MKLVESNEMLRAADILKGWEWSLDDFELDEMDMTDPASDELAPVRGTVHIRRKSNGAEREYVTGDGSVWVDAFDRDLRRGQFG